MKELLGIYPIKNRHSGKYEDAELFSPIGENNVDDFENQWRPAMEERRRSLAPNETVESANIQDAHWKWREKVQQLGARFDFDTFSVECNDSTQGLMLVNTVKFAKETSQHNKPLVYIELVSTAPWNRFGYTDNPIYKGVGPLLVGTAINLSINEGYKGRLGLHSLPQSETWYRDRCGMVDLGPDHDYPKNLRYFELLPEQAHSYINN